MNNNTTCLFLIEKAIKYQCDFSISFKDNKITFKLGE